MRLEQIRNVARSHNIKPGQLSKIALIKAIQIKEGNFDCFGSAHGGQCDQANCLWRDECFSEAGKH